jgi:transcriptional regulator with XRE-family HTH domain
MEVEDRPLAEDRPLEGFNLWLHRQLRRRDWSPADLARRMDVNTGTVSRWLTGSRRPRPDACDKLADALGVDLDMVLTLAGHRPPDIEIDPDSATARLMPLIEKIDWASRPNRLEEMEVELRFMIEVDRRKKAAKKQAK